VRNGFRVTRASLAGNAGGIHRVPDAVQRLFSAAPQSREPVAIHNYMGPNQQRTTEPVLGPRTARTRVQGRRVAQHPGHVAWAEISAATASIAGVTEPFQVHKTQGFASLCTMARRLLIHQPGK